MNAPSENIIVNSCEYTPIYLIPSTSVTQAGSYIITQSDQDARKPIADNLKSYYENSGNIESGIISSPKPRILKKQNANVVGNNLKLASFLIPKSENGNLTSVSNLVTVQPQTQPLVPLVQSKQPIPAVNNVTVKPTVTPKTTVPTNVDSNLPRVEIDRKIVRVGNIPYIKRTHCPRVLQKNKRIVSEQKEVKEKVDPNFSKYTSVQLIKLGETYHSLNQLSNDQMKIVNKALKMFSDPEKITKEPAYDPVTNTKFIYKVVSPRDLTVVGRNKDVIIKKKSEVKKHKIIMEEEPVEETPVQAAAPKVTRSGRTVRLPKQMRPTDAPHKPKKKIGNVVNCFQCSAEFCSLYRLQRHYENYPTHIPARIHSNLFHCLLAVIKGGSHHDQANIFIQQLEHLVEKIRTLLPCLMKNIDGKESKLCTINEDIGRLLGIIPGQYTLNVDALNCVKDKDGHCVHNPAPKQMSINTDISKPSQIWLSKHNEEIANNEAETEDCARINSVDKWPNITKRIWKIKQQREQKVHAKKMRLASENEQPIELGTEDVITFSVLNESGAVNVTKTDGSQEVKSEPLNAVDQTTIAEVPVVATESQSEKPKPYAQFHSTHFDIRSSPIKLPSSLVRKFQLHPDKLSNFEVQILRPLPFDKETTDQTESNCDLPSDVDLQTLFRDNVELPKVPADSNEHVAINYKKMTNANESTEDNFMKSNILFETGLTPQKNTALDASLLHLNNDTPSKDLIEAKILEIVESSTLIEPSCLQINDKPNGLFNSDPTLSHPKKDENDFYDPSYRHVKPKCNSLIGSSVIQMKAKTFESALSHVKERSNNLFGETMLHSENKCNSLINVKHESLFDMDMSHEKERSGSLFHSSLLDLKDKDSLLDSSLLQDDNSNLFNPSIPHSKDDGIMQQSLVHNTDSLNGVSLLHGKDKDIIRSSIHIDIHDEVSLGTNDSRLLNPSQSVLNFLDSLGNEPLELSYPETEIRNNSVDFQDLFSFNNS